eukprot:m.187399 g.187399  ORF g.187399 m.187399 type:complete len:167 (-) comp14773_c0_seq21:1614-2114(-)
MRCPKPLDSVWQVATQTGMNTVSDTYMMIGTVNFKVYKPLRESRHELWVEWKMTRFFVEQERLPPNIVCVIPSSSHSIIDRFDATKKLTESSGSLSNEAIAHVRASFDDGGDAESRARKTDNVFSWRLNRVIGYDGDDDGFSWANSSLLTGGSNHKQNCDEKQRQA